MAQIAALRLIVDDLDYGIVVLDRERHVQFVNGAFRRFWKIPDGLAESQPTFIKLMYHGCGVETYAVSHDRLGDYVAQQLALIRSGEERPLSIELRTGSVLQFRCHPLPGGGRLLTYGNISELYHQAEAIERLACLDGLTGLNNRRHFRALVEKEWMRFRRYAQPLSALMLDIDLFKSVNDTYGHDAGDEVLKSVAGILEKNKRAPDIAGRLGGEEFAVIFPQTTIENAVAAAERLRQLVAARTVATATGPITVTVSIGASFCRDDTSGIDQLLKEADAALYNAKRSGRNRVCQFAAKPPAVMP